MIKKRGIITFVFDDGYERIWKNIVPMLNKRNVQGVFAVAINSDKLEKTEQRKVTQWQQWLSIKKDGHEIASHTVNHPNLTELEDEALDEELRQSQEKLGAKTIVYPGGALDDRVVKEATRYYKAGRTVHYGFEELVPINPMKLKSYNFSKKNFSVRRANNLAIWAYLRNLWLIETYHMVDNEESDMVHAVKLIDFERHLGFVSKLPIDIRTIDKVIN